MSLWLARRLSLDLSTVDGEKEKRKKETEEEQYLLWMHLVPKADLPTSVEIKKVITSLVRVGFVPVAEGRMITVYPADIIPDELTFSTEEGVANQLANQGGGLLFRGRGAGIALVCDPHARTHSEVIRRAGLDDEILFGEYSLWMPRPKPAGTRQDEAAAGLVAVMPQVQTLLKSDCAFALTTDELAPLFLRWPYHRDISQNHKLNELFWYQAFGEALVSQAPLDDYRRARCTVEECEEGITVAQLGDFPSVGLTKLEAARDRWPHGMIPRRVC